MSQQSNGPGGPPPPRPPGRPGPPYAAPPTAPMPQWHPAMPRQPFRERTTKLWAALAVGLACLIVGLGIGVAIGHATGDDGPRRIDRFPGGPGGPGDGYRDGNRFGWGNRPQIPDGSGQDQQQAPQAPQGPGATG